MSAELRARYDRAVASHRADSHAVQTGEAYLMPKEDGIDPTTPPGRYMKHLRTGVNVAMVDHASLVRLLVDKGVITDLEYAEAMAAGMKAERERYEARVNQAFGGDGRIKLG